MKVSISTESCQKNGIEASDLLLLLAYYNNIDFKQSLDRLIREGLVTAAGSQPPEWRVTRKGRELIDAVAIDSEVFDRSDESLEKLAAELKSIFPQGRKDGTTIYWSEGKALIVRRLKAFFKKYGNNYTDSQIIEAAKSYVKSFNGNYKFMRTLRYFIFRDDVGDDGREYKSDLLNCIENVGQEELLRDDWMSTMV